MDTLLISSTIKKPVPKLPFLAVKNAILGKHYHLSLTFVGETRARSLNHQYRKKTYVPNVLSWALDITTGEIIITPAVAAREAHKFSLSVEGYVGYLFIHGCLHLKGHDHGDTMDKFEAAFMKKYRLK